MVLWELAILEQIKLTFHLYIMTWAKIKSIWIKVSKLEKKAWNHRKYKWIFKCLEMKKDWLSIWLMKEITSKIIHKFASIEISKFRTKNLGKFKIKGRKFSITIALKELTL